MADRLKNGKHTQSTQNNRSDLLPWEKPISANTNKRANPQKQNNTHNQGPIIYTNPIVIHYIYNSRNSDQSRHRSRSNQRENRKYQSKKQFHFSNKLVRNIHTSIYITPKPLAAQGLPYLYTHKHQYKHTDKNQHTHTHQPKVQPVNHSENVQALIASGPSYPPIWTIT